MSPEQQVEATTDGLELGALVNLYPSGGSAAVNAAISEVDPAAMPRYLLLAVAFLADAASRGVRWS